MIKSIKLLIALFAVLSSSVSFAQIKNAKTEKVIISGNCGMCKSKIEKSGNIKNICKLSWDSDSKLATITYDARKTNKNVILKRISLVGYDNELFTAPDSVYNNLHGCCQYERTTKQQ